MYYKATTLHRPESRALEIEILSRGFSSLPHPPSTREVIGGEAKINSRVWHDFLAAISMGGEFESSTGPTDGAVFSFDESFIVQCHAVGCTIPVDLGLPRKC